MEELRQRIRRGEPNLSAEWLELLRAAERELFESSPVELDKVLAQAFCTSVADIEKIPEGERPDGFRARSWYQLGRAVAKRLESDTMQAYLACLEAQLCMAENQRESAEEILTLAMRDYPEPSAFRVRNALLLSQLTRYRGSFDEALDWITHARQVLEELPENTSYRDSAACEVSGESYKLHLALGLLDQAARDREAEAELARRVGKVTALARVALHEVDWLLSSKRYELAAGKAQSRLGDESVASVPGVALQLELRRAIALAALGRRHPERNEEALGSVETVLDAGGLQPADRTSARVWQLELLLRLGRLAEARELRHEWRAEPDTDDAGRDPISLEDGAFLAALDTKLLLAGEPTEAELAEQLDRHRVAYESFLEGWKSAPLREDGIAFLRYRNRTMVLGEYLRLIRVALPGESGAIACLHALQQAQCMGTNARARGGSPVDLETIRTELMPAGGGFLVYAFGPERSHLLALDAQTIEVFELGSDDRISHAREGLAREIRRAPPGPELREERARRRETLAGLQRALGHELVPREAWEFVNGWEAVYVVGGDQLGRMPFGVARLEGERTLGEKLAICSLKTLPQAQFLLERSREGRASETSGDLPELAFLGAPLPAEAARARWPQLDELPFGREHLDALLRELGSPTSEVFLGKDANRSALLEPRLDKARLLWILAHGVSAPEFGSGSALVLSPASAEDDGLLRSADLLNASVPPLVLVSACGAGRGPRRIGDDRSAHFGGSLLEAGASSVVLSDSELELAAQVELLRVLFEECMRDGSTPAAALRDWLRALADDDLRSDPYYSQAYVFGLGHQPLRKE